MFVKRRIYREIYLPLSRRIALGDRRRRLIAACTATVHAEVKRSARASVIHRLQRYIEIDRWQLRHFLRCSNPIFYFPIKYGTIFIAENTGPSIDYLNMLILQTDTERYSKKT